MISKTTTTTVVLTEEQILAAVRYAYPDLEIAQTKPDEYEMCSESIDGTRNTKIGRRAHYSGKMRMYIRWTNEVSITGEYHG